MEEPQLKSASMVSDNVKCYRCAGCGDEVCRYAPRARETPSYPALYICWRWRLARRGDFDTFHVKQSTAPHFVKRWRRSRSV